MQTPPHSESAEASVLGSLLISAEDLKEVATLISAQDFYKEKHRHIYRAILKLFESGVAIDPVTVYQQLHDEGRIESIGGLGYIGLLTTGVPTAANVMFYVTIVRKKARLRRLMSIGHSLVHECSSDVDIEKAVEVQHLAETYLEEARQLSESATSDRGFTSLADCLHIVDEIGHGRLVKGAQTSLFQAMNDKLGHGYVDGDLILVAARPGMGKTALALQEVTHTGVANGRHVLFCVSEMYLDACIARILCQERRIDHHVIRSGNWTPKVWELIRAWKRKAAGCGVHFVDADQMDGSIEKVITLAHKANRVLDGGLSMLIVDYIQDLHSIHFDNKQSRDKELGYMAKALKRTGKDIHCPVICLAQLNRGLEARPNKRPLLNDLRDSGTLEQAADVVVFIYRDDYYFPWGKDEYGEPVKPKGRPRGSGKVRWQGQAEIIVAKNRHGKTGLFFLDWTANHIRFDRWIDKGEP